MLQQIKISPFQNAIISKAYDKFCERGWPISINDNEMVELADKTKTDHTEIESQVRELMQWGLLKPGDSFSRHVTWECLDTYERNFPEQRVFAHNKIRRLLLEIAYYTRNNDHGFVESEEVYTDPRANDLNHTLIYSNVEFLHHAGHIEGNMQSGMSFFYRITDCTLATDKLKIAEFYPISANDRVSLANIAEVVKGWTPRQARRVEETYKAELAEYLIHNGFPKTREEEGASNPDVLVDELLPIEVKKNPDQGELDRMSGQMMRMINEFGAVIACIVQTAPGQDRIERFKKTWRDNDKVVVIVKKR